MKIFRPLLCGVVLAMTSLGAIADKININDADASALAALHGIGQAKAEAIVEHRDSNGPFRSIDDLANVKGLGASIVERNRDRLTVGNPPADPDQHATAN